MLLGILQQGLKVFGSQQFELGFVLDGGFKKFGFLKQFTDELDFGFFLGNTPFQTDALVNGCFFLTPKAGNAVLLLAKLVIVGLFFFFNLAKAVLMLRPVSFQGFYGVFPFFKFSPRQFPVKEAAFKHKLLFLLELLVLFAPVVQGLFCGFKQFAIRILLGLKSWLVFALA